MPDTNAVAMVSIMQSRAMWMGLALVAALGAAGPAEATPNLVVNGSFEQLCPTNNTNPEKFVVDECTGALCTAAGNDNLPGWSVIPATIDPDLAQENATGAPLIDEAPPPPSCGLEALYFGAYCPTCSTAESDTIEQTIPTVAGETYDVAFCLADSPSSGGHFQETFGAQSLVECTPTSGLAFTRVTACFTATGPSTLLSFAGQQRTGWVVLDAVSVTANTPEVDPARAAVPLMVIVGALAVLADRRSRHLGHRPGAAG